MALQVGDRVRCIHLPYFLGNPEFADHVLQPDRIYEIVKVSDPDPEEALVDLRCLTTGETAEGWLACRFEVVVDAWVPDRQEPDPWE